MLTRSRQLATLVGVPVLLVLGGCGGSDDAGSSSAGSNGPPACSKWSDGQKITEKLSLEGCSGDEVSIKASTTCTDAAGDVQRLLAVGPVYGVIGGPAMYVEGQDATKSAEWDKLQADCPAPTS